MPRVDLLLKGRPGAGYCFFHISPRPISIFSQDKCINYGRITVFGERGIGLNTFSKI